VLLDMDRHFRLQNKKILLLIDNVPSHFDSNYHPPAEEDDNNNDNDNEVEALESNSRNRAGASRSMHK